MLPRSSRQVKQEIPQEQRTPQRSPDPPLRLTCNWQWREWGGQPQHWNSINKALGQCLRWRLFIIALFAPIKGRSQCYALLYCDGYGHLRTWHIYNARKTLHKYRRRVVEFSLYLENKLQSCQIIWSLNTSTYVFTLYW